MIIIHDSCHYHDRGLDEETTMNYS